MTPEQKRELLQELCARLPYGVKCQRGGYIEDLEGIHPRMVHSVYLTDKDGCTFNHHIEEVKPYLRTIASMTEKEVQYLFDTLQVNEEDRKEWLKVNDIGVVRLFTEEGKDFYEIADAMDYLYSIHVDFRGVIHRKLAIEAPEGMYKID